MDNKKMSEDQIRAMTAMKSFNEKMAAASRGENVDVDSLDLSSMPFLNTLGPADQARAKQMMLQMMKKSGTGSAHSAEQAKANQVMQQMMMQSMTGGGGAAHAGGDSKLMSNMRMMMQQKQEMMQSAAPGHQQPMVTGSAMNTPSLMDSLNPAHDKQKRALMVAMMGNIHEALNVLPLNELEKVLEGNPSIVHQRGFNGMSPLHKVVLRSDPAVLDLFMKYKLNVNSTNDYDETPLHFACRKGNIVMIERLINAGANVSAIDKSGRGVMHHAAIGGSVLTMYYLNVVHNQQLTTGDRNLITPLHLSCAHGHEEGLLYLIRKNRCSVHVRDIHGNTALHIAAQYGQAYICWKLIEIGGLKMIHETNKEGLTPIRLAQAGPIEKNKFAIDLLAVYGEQKCDANQKAVGPTPVWYALLTTPTVSFILIIILSNLFEYSGYPMAVLSGLQGYFIYSQHHRMNHISKWPNPIQAGMFAGGIFTSIAMYMVEVLPEIYMERKMIGVLSVIGCTLIIYMYYRLMTNDPGVCTESTRKPSTGHTYTVKDIASGEIRLEALCTICEIIPPGRTRHCRLCEKCYLELDHHCLFLYKCVAKYNHRLFIYFILLCAFAMLCYCWLVVEYCMGLHPEEAPTSAVVTAFHQYPGLVGLGGINAMSSVWLFTLLNYQLKLISKHHTTAYQPCKYTTLTRWQRLRNVVNFLLGKAPYAVNSVLKTA